MFSVLVPSDPRAKNGGEGISSRALRTEINFSPNMKVVITISVLKVQYKQIIGAASVHSTEALLVLQSRL
jgi:hypothetical protein